MPVDIETFNRDCAIPVRRIVTILDGDKETDTKGMRQRLRELEDKVDSLEQKAQYVKWVGVGLALQVGLLAALSALVARAFGAIP